MEKANLKTIREHMAEKGWSIEIHGTLAYVYNVTSPNQNVTTIKVAKPTNDFYKELIKADTIGNFVKKYVFDADAVAVRTPRSSSSSKQPINIDENYIGISLKKRQAKNNKQQDAEESEVIDTVIQRVEYNVEIPRHLHGYYFPKYTGNILTRVALGRNILITGPTGTGKSEFVVHLAELVHQKVIRVNLSVGTTEGHLVGKFIAKNGSTEFIDGILPLAMKNGWWLLLDEVDCAQPEHLAVMQSVLEGDSLLIVQNENEEVVPHENFRVFATANTKGRGDESQSYTGTNVLNMAWLDRWSIFEMNYTEFEKDIVRTILNKDAKLANQVMTYFEMLRKIVDSGQLLNTAFSTRRMQQVCEMLAMGEPLRDVLKFEVECRYSSSEAGIIAEVAADIWEKQTYMSKAWKIGMEHCANELPNNK